MHDLTRSRAMRPPPARSRRVDAGWGRFAQGNAFAGRIAARLD